MIYLIGSSIIKKWSFPLESINLGIGGLLTSELYNQYSKLLFKFESNDSLIFYCGGNDVRKNEDITTITNNIIELLSILDFGLDIYVISVVKCEKIYEIGRSGEVDIINDNLKNFCKLRGYKYIDSNSIFEHDCQICQNDGIHLYEAGYKQLETLIENYEDDVDDENEGI